MADGVAGERAVAAGGLRARWWMAGVVVAGLLWGWSGPVMARAASMTVAYRSPGRHYFTVPANVTSVTVVVIGAPGGSCPAAPAVGGMGAAVTASFPVYPDDVLLAQVGSAGGDCGSPSSSSGGAPGGGNGGSGRPSGAGGGGLSLVQLSSSRHPLPPNSDTVLAGGGGGAANFAFNASARANGGNAGRTGTDGGNAGGRGGTMTAGGEGSGGQSGEHFVGGAGATSLTRCPSNPGGGGGGAGYYGGGGGDGCATSGGGGGSSYVDPAATLLYGPYATRMPTSPGVSITFSAPATDVSSSALQFGGLGAPRGVQVVRVTNYGSQRLIVSGALVSGRDASDFQVDLECQRPLARGASCVVRVRFVGRGAGSQSATLTLLTGAPTPVAAVRLTGSASGPAPPPARASAHRVALIWCAGRECAARVVSGIATFTAVGSRVPAQLWRGRVLYASGARVITRSSGELVVNQRLPLTPGAYTLRLRWRQTGRWRTVAATIVVRLAAGR